MPTLYVVSDYKNRELSYKGDSLIEVDDELADYLMRDAPENFAIHNDYSQPSKALDEPPKNKMIGAPDYKKMTVQELKDELASRGLKIGGNKAQLVKRLENA